MVIEKRCSRCRKKKPLSDFGKNKHNKDGYTYWCKHCRSKYYAPRDYRESVKRWKKSHKDGVKEYNKKYNKKYYQSHRKYFKEHSKMQSSRRLGLTPEERDLFIVSRGSCCEVCGISRGTHYELFNSDLCIDHCHLIGEIKGVLCNACNRSAGLLRDDIGLAWKLFKYLERTRTV